MLAQKLAVRCAAKRSIFISLDFSLNSLTSRKIKSLVSVQFMSPIAGLFCMFPFLCGWADALPCISTIILLCSCRLSLVQWWFLASFPSLFPYCFTTFPTCNCLFLFQIEFNLDQIHGKSERKRGPDCLKHLQLDSYLEGVSCMSGLWSTYNLSEWELLCTVVLVCQFAHIMF